jgi:hypothetical protein
MEPTVESSTDTLFRQWRHGNAEAGRIMAQRFSDWYYAVASARLGEVGGREPLERTCQAFAQGIVTVTRPSALVDWAHGLLEDELQTIGRGLDAGPDPGGDHPNALTKNQSPTALIQAAAATMDPAQVRLLANAFHAETAIGTVERIGDEMGGLPLAMLEARYSLKRALHTTAEVPFAVLPDEADMDRAPIGLYEAGRLASGDEVCTLEKWLLTDIDLCRDIAEFAAFVHAMRGGALADQRGEAPVVTAEPPAPEPAPAVEPPAPAPEPAPEVPPESDDFLIDPDDLDLDAVDEDMPGPPSFEPEPDHPPATATVGPAAPPSTMRSIMTVAAAILLGSVLLLVGMVYLLRG